MQRRIIKLQAKGLTQKELEKTIIRLKLMERVLNPEVRLFQKEENFTNIKNA
jgi:hypothetical protein